MSKRKLLLADDSITIQKVVNLTFADEGIEVIAVGDGDAAMQKFVEIMPDLVMADVNMPGIDGYRICEMIKQDEETMQIPVILLVGSFEPFDEEEARRVGADDFLTKPFQSIRQLVNKVTELLNSSNGEEPAMVEEIIRDEASEPMYMETAAAQLGDAGMDDEMIQTNQIGVLPIDEPQKFESEYVKQSFEDSPPVTLSTPYQSDFEDSTGNKSDEDFAKTQPLTTQEFHEITAPSAEYKSVEPEEKSFELVTEQYSEETEISNEMETIEPEIADNQPVFEPEEVTGQQFAEPEIAEESEQIKIDEGEREYIGEDTFSPTVEVSETVPMPEGASVLDLDEMNLLELPTSEKHISPVFQTAPVEMTEPEIAEPPKPEPDEIEEDETADYSPEFISLSPASIEAIAERVADLVVKKWSQQTSDNQS